MQNMFYELFSYKGFLLAWIMEFSEVWAKSIAEGHHNCVRHALSTMVPEKQWRWYKGASLVVYTHVVVSKHNYVKKCEFALPG